MEMLVSQSSLCFNIVEKLARNCFSHDLHVPACRSKLPFGNSHDFARFCVRLIRTLLFVNIEEFSLSLNSPKLFYIFEKHLTLSFKSLVHRFNVFHDSPSILRRCC